MAGSRDDPSDVAAHSNVVTIRPKTIDRARIQSAQERRVSGFRQRKRWLAEPVRPLVPRQSTVRRTWGGAVLLALLPAVLPAVLLLRAGCASAEKPAFRCSYYAAPTQTDGGVVPDGGAFGGGPGAKGSFGAPGTVMNFFDNAAPGDSLCLRSGTYRGKLSMIVPPRGFGGEAGRPISIRALADGEVWIDGENRHATIAFTGPYWHLRGVNAYDSKSGILAIAGRSTDAHHIVVERVVVWRNPGKAYENAMNVDISFAKDVLLEDVACFGTARKCVQVHRSKSVTLRRVFARWDGRWPYLTGNEFAISPMYGSFDSLAENIIATSGGVDLTGYTPGIYKPKFWLIGTDPMPLPEDVLRWAPGRDEHDVRLRTLGSIAYAKPDQRFVSNGVLMTRAGMKGSVLQDVVVSVPASSERVIVNHECLDNEFHCVWKPGDTPNRAVRLTLIGGPPKVRTKWKLGDFVTSDIRKVEVQQPVDIFTPADGGAAVCNRYVDGQRTQDPLWPWPMNERIVAATRRSGWGETDVTADIQEIFGAIPAKCTGSPPG